MDITPDVLSAKFAFGEFCSIHAAAHGVTAMLRADSMISVLSMIHGQTDIYKTLQAIKLALHQARSDDPKLASVAVCRFQNEPNDQAEQLLICATNAAWSKHAAASSPAYVAATAAMPVIVAIQTQNTVLNPMLMNAPGNELQTMVDGTALRALLEKIPYPTSASPATPAPAASTHS